jgi:hypothetical protein
MGHYAQIDENDIVVQVIVAKGDLVAKGTFGDPSKWIKTSYNTTGGVHYTPDTIVDGKHVPDGGVALRKNYAGKGFTYDHVRDAFIGQKPYPSWVLDEDTCQWKDPVEGRYNDRHLESTDPDWDPSTPITQFKNWVWDEPTTSWVHLEYPKWVDWDPSDQDSGDWERNEDGSVKG